MRVAALIVLTGVLPCLAASPSARYRVTLTHPGDDAALVAKRLAAAYHGQLETPLDANGTFLITLSSATADLIARDPLVAGVVAPDAATNWNLGTYAYDDAGNISRRLRPSGNTPTSNSNW